jgi:hypothetical protein
MGSQMFWKCQYGKETVRGTAVASTKRFYGSANIPKDRSLEHPEYLLGVRAKSGMTEIRQILADGVTLSMDNGYYQGLPFMLGSLLQGGLTPAEVTVGKGDYKWIFTQLLTTLGNPDTFTLQYGDNDQAYAIEYLMGKKINFDFSLGDNSDVKVSQEFFGRQVSKVTFTAAINVPATTEPIVANTMQMWLDGTWATLGTTAKTSLLRSGSIEIGSGNHPKFLANGAKTFSTHGEGDIYGACKFVFEGGADAVAIFDAYQLGTPKALRFKTTGSLISAGSAPYSMQIDLYGTFDEVIPLSGDKDGNTLYGAVFSTITDLQATQHNVGVEVVVNQSVY